MLNLLLDIPQRKIFHIEQNTGPASFLIVDDKAGGILINTPIYSEILFNKVSTLTRIDYLFLPSKFGANPDDIKQWKSATNAETIAHELEVASIDHPIDIKVNHKTKLSRTMDFVPMGGRTTGSCALFLKNLPGVIFLGPILSANKNGWPDLKKNDDDSSFEARMFGVLGLKDLKYDYAFTDDFNPEKCKFGPDASVEIKKNIDQFFT